MLNGSSYVWTAAATADNEMFFESYLYWRWKVYTLRSMVRSLCATFDGDTTVLFIMSCFNLQLMRLSRLWKKNGRYTSKDTVTLFGNMTTLDQMLHNPWKPSWKCLNGKFLLITTLLLITWLSSNFISMNISWSWIATKDVLFFQGGIQMLSKRSKKLLLSMDNTYIELHVFYNFLK